MISRRDAFGSLAASTALALAPALRAKTGGKPARLRKGNTVGLVCPAGFVADRFGIDQVEETIRAMGLVPKAGSHLLDRHGYLAGRDTDRAADLVHMFADPDVKAIFAVRGGWGCQRLLPLLDFDTISANPKLLVGSSDITALHLAIAARAGFPTIHGPNAAHSWPDGTWQDFRGLAFEAATPTYSIARNGSGRLSQRDPHVRTFRAGKARGKLLGGNLSVLSAMVGTPYLPDFSGAILFLEDTNEAEYRIDRMLEQLFQAGVLNKVSGIVFGQCSNCRNPGSPYGNFTIYEVLDHHFSRIGVPAFQGAAIGHIARQVSIPVGVEAEIDATSGTIRMLEPAVA